MKDFKKLEQQLQRDNQLGWKDNGDGTRTFTYIGHTGIGGDMMKEYWTEKDYKKEELYIKFLKKQGLLKQ